MGQAMARVRGLGRARMGPKDGPCEALSQLIEIQSHKVAVTAAGRVADVKSGGYMLYLLFMGLVKDRCTAIVIPVSHAIVPGASTLIICSTF